MKGYHKVQKFYLNKAEYARDLPEGWKPFAAVPVYAGKDRVMIGHHIIARKWVNTSE